MFINIHKYIIQGREQILMFSSAALWSVKHTFLHTVVRSGTITSCLHEEEDEVSKTEEAEG